MRGSISCVILKFKPIDAVFFNTAFSNTLRPCGLTFPRTTRNRKSAVPQNRSRSLFAPRRPVLAGFYPRWGNDPSPPGQGLVWAPQGPVWQKEKKTAHPSGWGKIWGCEKTAGERPGVAHRRPVPGHFARQSRSFRDFSQASISPFSGVGLAALGSRPGSEKQNFPVASHFCGCHRRGQRKDEEKYVR